MLAADQSNSRKSLHQLDTSVCRHPRLRLRLYCFCLIQSLCPPDSGCDVPTHDMFTNMPNDPEDPASTRNPASVVAKRGWVTASCPPRLKQLTPVTHRGDTRNNFDPTFPDALRVDSHLDRITSAAFTNGHTKLCSRCSSRVVRHWKLLR